MRRRRYGRGIAGVFGLFMLVLAAGCGSDTDEGNGGGDTSASQEDVGTDADISSDTEPDGDGTDGEVCTYFPDSCGEGRNCYPDISDDGIERVCLKYNGDRSTGDACEGRADCASGDRCFDDECRTMCDPGDGERCGSEAVCLTLTSMGHKLAWGICEPKADKCTIWPNDDCGDGENCYSLKQGNRCLEFNAEASVGDSCQGSPDCNAGQTCIERDGESESHCRDKCDEEHPCESGKCQSLSSAPYGACLPEKSGG